MKTASPTAALILLALLAGCGGSTSPTAPAVVLDTAPPAVPAGLCAAPGDLVVKLGWSPNTTDHDFLGYNVYRMVGSRGVLLNAAPLTDAGYVDTMPWPVENRYAVTSVDLSGNESAWSTVALILDPDLPDRRRQ